MFFILEYYIFFDGELVYDLDRVMFLLMLCGFRLKSREGPVLFIIKYSLGIGLRISVCLSYLMLFKNINVLVTALHAHT